MNSKKSRYITVSKGSGYRKLETVIGKAESENHDKESYHVYS